MHYKDLCCLIVLLCCNMGMRFRGLGGSGGLGSVGFRVLGLSYSSSIHGNTGMFGFWV